MSRPIQSALSRKHPRYSVGRLYERGNVWYSETPSRRVSTRINVYTGSKRGDLENLNAAFAVLEREILVHLGYAERFEKPVVRHTVYSAIERFTKTALIGAARLRLKNYRFAFEYFFPNDMALDYNLLRSHIESVQVRSVLLRSTLLSYLILVRRFFRHCVENDWIEKNPITTINVKSDSLRRDGFTYDQVHAISTWLKTEGDNECGLLVDFIGHTGARIHEALALRWENVTDTAVRFEVAKGGRSREFPIQIVPGLSETVELLRLCSTGRGVFRWSGRSSAVHFFVPAVRAVGLSGSFHDVRRAAINRWRTELGFGTELRSILAGNTIAVQERHYLRTLTADEIMKMLR
jgi:integrase